MSTSFIVGWLEEKQIVDLLFGKGLHFELISRSKDILRVLSEFKRYFLSPFIRASLTEYYCETDQIW